MTYPLSHKRRGSGFTMQGRAGENLGSKKLVYQASDGLWYLADADIITMMPSIGITMGSIRQGVGGMILRYGFIGSTTWAWTLGASIYATTTPGELSQTAPNDLRQTIGRATKSNMIFFNPENVENEVYWSNTHRTRYSITGSGARVDEELSGGEWWTVNCSYAEVYMDTFNGIFDITGLGIASVISNYAYYAVMVGAGTYTANAGPSTGMRMTTGALVNNSNLIATGDNTGIGLSWNPAQTVWMHLHYRFPNAGDAVNSEFLGAFYRDANNYVGIRYDTAVDNNLRLVTRAAAAETLTVIGPLDTNWHEIFVKFSTGEVRFCQDGAVVVHTTNVPAGNFAWYNYLETLAVAAKNYDVSLLTLIQDEVEP